MSLKKAALLALFGMILLTILTVGSFISDVLAVTAGLLPALRLITSLILAFAAASAAVFFYVFQGAQS